MSGRFGSELSLKKLESSRVRTRIVLSNVGPIGACQGSATRSLLVTGADWSNSASSRPRHSMVVNSAPLKSAASPHRFIQQ